MPAQQRRHLGRGVVVGVHRVVDEPGLHGAVARRALFAHLLVGAPLRPRVDVGLRGSRHGAERHGVLDAVAVGRGPDACGPAPAVPAASAVLAEGSVGGVDRRSLLGHRAGARVDDGQLQVGRDGDRRWSRRASAPGRRRR